MVSSQHLTTDTYPQIRRQLLGFQMAVGIQASDEDYVVKQISEELRLPHSDYIAARLRFKQYLAVLKLGTPESKPKEN